jgi:DNA-binding XRE family transcriptional regulator
MQNYKSKRVPNGLRKHRVAADLTQQQIARILGLKQHATVAQWESGSRLPSLITAFKLAAIHSVYVEALFFDLMDSIRQDIKPRIQGVLDNVVRK